MQAQFASRDLIVRVRTRNSVAGWLEVGGIRFPCALGRSGISHLKTEGDGTTPAGRWQIERILLRGDRRPYGQRGIRHFATGQIRPADGWCDAVSDRNYNRPVRHPYPASAEHLWRSDHLYDVILVLSHNRCPRTAGRGSAVFLHVAEGDGRGGLAPTAGCVALARRDLDIVLARLRPGAHLVVP